MTALRDVANGWSAISEHAPLRAVLVHSPGLERLSGQHRDTPERLAALQSEHASLVGALRRSVGDVLLLRNLVNDIGESVDPLCRSLLWTRDLAVATADGLIPLPLGRHRRAESHMLDLVLERHPRFVGAPVRREVKARVNALPPDLREDLFESLILEGGNILILSSSALAVGFRRRGPHDLAALEVAIEALFAASPSLEHIYTVQLAPGFEHLDCVLSLFGTGAALAMPQVLRANARPLDPAGTLYLRLHAAWLRHKYRPNAKRRFSASAELAGLGRAERVERGAVRLPGPESPHLLDLLIADKFIDADRLIWIGGDAPAHTNALEHFRVAAREQKCLAGNLLTIRPDHLITCEGNPMTSAALAAVAGLNIRIEHLNLTTLAAGFGGPRCLTLPLGRLSGLPDVA